MIRRLIGPFVVFLLVSLTAVVAHFFASREEAALRLSTSNLESAKGSIRIGLDAYAGYAPIRSKDFRNRLLKNGYRLELIDDQGDYAQRVEALANGSLELAVFTVDSFVLNGLKENYPGSIIAVLSESTGSDGIVSAAPPVTDLDALKQETDLRIAYTPDSPSEHFLKAISADFGMQDQLTKNRSNKRPVTGSQDALKALKKGDADIAVLWEPELSKAKADTKLNYLIGSESTPGLIVDVLVASTETLNDHPEKAEAILEAYFQQLIDYRKDRAAFIKALADDAGTQKNVAEQIAQGIAWKGYEANAAIWLGTAQNELSAEGYRLYNSIERTVSILIETGDFSRNMLPQQDPRSLIFERPLRNIGTSKSLSRGNTSDTAADLLSHDFSPLSPDMWQRLPKVGTLKLRPISFRSGTNELSDAGVEAITQMIDSLRNYPDFRVIVSGHTNSRGDPEANRELSRTRANRVVDYIHRKFAVDADRLLAVGHGSDQPLSRNAGESFRAHQNRLARVEFSFVRDSL
ncbi:MAG: OmpA family protein [Coraliomargarita sp.]|nr:OmpA family protein [Coraliomargarita sp.]